MNRDNAIVWVVGLMAAVAFVGAVVWSLMRALKAWRVYRRITDTPTSRIGDLRNGFFEVRGKVVDVDDPLISPLSRTPCVYYQFTVKERRTSTKSVYRNGRRTTRTHSEWVTIINDRKTRPCDLEDASGRVRVPLMSADLHLKRDAHERSGFLDAASEELKQTLSEQYNKGTEGWLLNKAMTYEETVICGGDLLYVIGCCRRPAGGQPTFEADEEEMFLVADRPEKEIAAKFLWQAGGHVAAALAVVAGAVWIAVAAVRAGQL